MKLAKFLAPLVALPLSASPALAADDDRELWVTLGASGPIAGKVTGSLETQIRFSDDDEGLYEFQAGGFVGTEVAEDVTLQLGYVRVQRYADGRRLSVEDRPRVQLGAALGRVLGGQLSARLRAEQRIRGGETGWRLRPQLRYVRALGAKTKTSLAVSHESFLALNATDFQESGYVRMRNFAGLTFPVAPKLRAELGYLNQWDIRGGREDAVNHIAFTSLNISW